MNINAGGARPQNLSQFQTHIQNKRQATPQQVHVTEAQKKTVGGFIREKAQVITKKNVVDMDARIKSIDERMNNLGNKGIKGVEPKALKSKWSIFGKVIGDMFKSIPTALTGIVKGALKLTSYLAEAAVHVLVLPFSALGAHMTEDASVMTDAHKGVHKLFDKMRGGLDKAQEKFEKWYGNKVGIGDQDTAKEGAEKIASTVDVVSGYMGTNILKSGGDMTETQDPNAITTGGDGDKALQVGIINNANAVMGDLEKFGKQLKGIDEGQQLINEGNRSVNPTEKEFLVEQGKMQKSQARWGLADASRSLVSNLNGTTNLLVGSNTPVVTNVTATNITQAMGGGFSALSNSVEATVETIQAVQADRKIGRCNQFLEKTAIIEGNQEITASKNTEKVRDSVKLYKKNQTQTRNTTLFSAISKMAMTAAAIVGTVLFVAACASNPVGWAVGGAAIALGIGMAAYKGYKAARRADQTKGLEERRTQVSKAMVEQVNDLSAKLGVNTAEFKEAGKLKLGQLTTHLEGKVQELKNQQPPPENLAELIDQLDTVKELKSLRSDINSALKQTNGATAMDGLVKALNDRRDPDGQLAAEFALRDVFRMDPDLFKTNENGDRIVSAKVADKADDKLREKLSMFHASVYSKN
ncbi:hypothetical protein COW36_16850 [bacterium (Candidatus Blackallbacteria) CG17_big_fil_post_rev_8_21_14_2_50_48_46]|uniref:Uncharacterized protein n=1 Tax=bacterium (Candidatus Blackallbacteria) CG17_big_fil_post_rev_8_21_14_2_50_48_46 TaxID=2014261 RepID=A0A2M7G1E1_9BACT|nr:MAG: hypothetical protein COW64_22350 [bacterium (Candidatus Blackallbacteria) CG18_big_fil_WC_8_21_14_2_50_49_26]PIW15545.1 MAG: hypothetical protein COW36_16850 [bacterium (Candidatus Blackallbacteria) CG17_big_fil_post_rev_8_21_14_2_50_48_46]PIW50287.1 MAG: hypothetical protein COW20_03115 [bacterium (Candidatus Blackallbacteria) CG13_big_fil_rev_8_21_14_2_50_49_14]